MNATCTLCDAPCEAGEALCTSCLADPVQRASYDAAARAARRASDAASWSEAAHAALRMARAYRAEGGAGDARARACIDEARRCRDAARLARAGIPGAGPGLRKTVPRGDAPGRRAAGR